MNLCNPLICHGYYDDDDHGYDWFQTSCDHSLFVTRKRADWKSGPSEPRKPDHDDDDGLTWLTFTNCLID